MNIAGITDRGKIRRENQDAFYTWKGEGYALGLVCDGMGGAKAGNIASAIAARRFAEVVSSMPGRPEPRLTRAAELANVAVYQRAKSDDSCWGLGTTLVAGFASDTEAHIINIGDSRCYLIRDQVIRQVSRDHSLVQELVDLGRITPEQARIHPNRNIITRALGTERNVRGDLYVEPLNPGDRLLLCSDGLSNEVQDHEILELMQGTPEESCQKLLELALERNAPDNVTVVILEAERSETEQAEESA